MDYQEQDCPLCGKQSKYTYEKEGDVTVKKILCPQCKNLTFEEGTEDEIYSFYLQSSKDEAIAKSKGLSASQALYFSWNHKQKNMNGKSSILMQVINK